LKLKGYPALIFLVVVSFLLAAGGCGLGGGGGQGLSSTSTSGFDAASNTQSATSTTTTLAPADELSTFKAKDPFIQQAQTTTTIAAPSTSQSSTTSSTGSSGSSTSSTTSTSNTASAYAHSLKILTIEMGPTVTFRVDGIDYDAKRVGDVVTTTWGQIEVRSIDMAGENVTLLQGSETLGLKVGQTTFG